MYNVMYVQGVTKKGFKDHFMGLNGFTDSGILD